MAGFSTPSRLPSSRSPQKTGRSATARLHPRLQLSGRLRCETRETVRLLADWVLQCEIFEADVLADGIDDRVIGNLAGKAAIDIAMRDLRGRLLGRPVA